MILCSVCVTVLGPVPQCAALLERLLAGLADSEAGYELN